MVGEPGSASSRGRGGERAVSPVVGFVLLVGLVAIASVGIVLASGTLLSDIEGRMQTQAAETSMREMDSRLGEVAYGTRGSHSLEFQSEDVRVVADGRMEIAVANGSHVCSETLRFGTIERTTDTGRVVAYQAGGVWQRSVGSNGSVMLSPPNIQYRGGTLTFSLVNVSGYGRGYVDELAIRKNHTASQQKSEALESVFSNASRACNPPENMTITVESAYYQAWGSFFRTHVNGSSVTVNHSARTASLELLQVGSSLRLNEGDNAVTSDHEFTADVEVLGTELSGAGGPWWDPRKYSAPITFVVNADGASTTPWPDADPSDDIAGPIQDDLNNPARGEEFSYSFDNVTSVSVEATSWHCDGFTDTGVDTEYDDATYSEYRCADAGGERIPVSSDSNSNNTVLRVDGDEVPNFGAAGPEQRNLTQILGDRIEKRNGSAYLDLDRNEVVYFFELSEPDADPENAGGGGDPDYNDAIVVVTINEAGSVGVPENFAIHINVNQVVVSET